MGRKPEGKAEKMFKKFGKKIDELLVDLDKVKDDAKVEYADRIEELKRNGETLKQEAKDFMEDHKDTIEKVETQLKKVGNEFRDAVENVFGDKEKK